VSPETAIALAPLVSYARAMLTTGVVCSQCGRDAPSDPVELMTWRHGELALEGEVDEGLLLCPDCDAEDQEREFDEGAGE
jgi:hypothetical protein